MKEIIRFRFVTPKEWRENGSPFKSWLYSFETRPTKDNNTTTQLSFLGLNLAIKY